MATIGETVSGGTAGSVLFVGAGPVLAQDNANLFWNNTDKKLGIGTTSPLNDLTVRKSDTGTVGIDVINTNTTEGAANAQVFLQVAGANGGDAVTVYEVFQGARWIVGIDNSDSDKFKFVASTQSAQLCLAMTTDGKIGVNELNPSAKLHLAAGTASLAPLKLTAGTNLTTPEAGAVEFDGTNLFLTRSDGIRRSLTNNVANVLDFGAVGDGTTDDSAAFQAAADSLVETGGVVWVPPNRKYVIGNVNVIAKYPVWIISRMYGHFVGVGAAAQNEKGSIVPKPGTSTTHVFKWERHSSLTVPGFGAGGGISGLCLCDIPHNGTLQQARQTAISAGAVWITDAAEFMVRECLFMWLNATALKLVEGNFFQVESCNFDECGASGKPVIEVGGGTTNANVFSRRLFIQAAHSGQIKMLSGTLNHTHSYHENGADRGGETQPMIDGTSGRVHVSDCLFWGHQAESIIIGVTESEVADCMFHNHPGTKHTIDVNSGGVSSRFSSLRIWRTGAGRNINVSSAHWCTFNDIHCIGGGGIFSDSLESLYTGIYLYAPQTAEGQYAIHLTGDGNVLAGGAIIGRGVSQCHGIAVNGTLVTGMIVRDLAGTASKGIAGFATTSSFVGNWVSGVTGPAYVYANGQKASGNQGGDGTVTASAGAATLHRESGIVTESLTTGAGLDYTLTLTNQMIDANSNVLVQIYNGSNTIGPLALRSVTPAAGSVSIVVRNGGASNLNGTIKVAFQVIGNP
jgi:hypothetical protein